MNYQRCYRNVASKNLDYDLLHTSDCTAVNYVAIEIPSTRVAELKHIERAVQFRLYSVPKITKKLTLHRQFKESLILLDST